MKLEQLQYGVQSVFDTPVAATKRLLGSVKVQQDVKITIPQDDIGLNVNGYRSVKSGKLVTNTIEIPRAYYQVLPLIFSTLLTNDVTPTGTTAFTWEFEPDLSKDGNPHELLTLENGDLGIQGFQNANVVFEKVKISGSIPQDGGDAPITISVDYFAKEGTKASYTASIDLPTVTELSAFLAKLYIDTSWAAVGTTLKSGILRAFDIEIVGGFYPEFHGGRDTFDTVGEGVKSILINLTIDAGTESQALYDALGQMRVVKLDIQGPLINVTDHFELAVEASCQITAATPYDSQEKDTQLATVTLEGIYDVTGEKMVKVKVVTDDDEI